MCPRCELPVSLVLCPEAGGVGPNWFVLEAGYGKHDLIKASKWSIRAFFPTPTPKRVPEHVPIDIARIYQQAISCLLRREKEAAALLLRRSAEKALDKLNCIQTGSLSDRVNCLAREGRIANYFGQWASELHLLSTPSEIDDPKLDDLRATAEFVEAFVLSAFTLDGMFELRRSRIDSCEAVD
jgi:hypothetical protein